MGQGLLADEFFYSCLFVVEVLIFLLAFAAFVKFVIDVETRDSKSLLLRSLLAESVLIFLLGFPAENALASDLVGIPDLVTDQIILNLADLYYPEGEITFHFLGEEV